MNWMGAASYHCNVNLLGKPFLRYQRLRSEQRMKKPYAKQNPHLAPFLNSVPHLKELITRHYLEARHADKYRKVAWVTSGAPVEFLKALGYFTFYPENHGAVCGIRRKAVELCSESENLGYCRDLCSYARTDIGSVFSGKTAVGHISRPDLLVCCTNICQTVLYWYEVLAHHFKVPLVVIDTPFMFEGETPHALEYVKKQLEYAIEESERVAGHSLDYKKFRVVGQAARDTLFLWLEIMKCGMHRPAPISAFDEFFFMAPIVDMRGEQVAVDFYRRVLAEVKQRIRDGVGAVTNEKKRLLWDNLPIWHYVRELSETLAERGFSIVASTYTNAWGELAPMVDIDRPLESLARTYMHVILNRSTGNKLATMVDMARDYSVDGVILHNNRSCKPYSLGQIDQRDRIMHEHGIPTLLLEADHNDTRSFSAEQVDNRISAFMEMVEGA